MTRITGLFAIFGALLLLCLTAVAGYAALGGCAVRLSFLSHINGCPSDAELRRQAQMDQLTAEREALLASIHQAERAIAGQQCTAALPDVTAPLPDRGWRDSDLSTLYGCWSLGSSYQTRDVDTGTIISYPDWHMCFNAIGEGKQIMRGDDGSICEGPVQARIDDANRLVLGEGGNLTCDDGGYIHRRDIACGRADGGISCETLQPETKGAATVPLSRLR